MSLLLPLSQLAVCPRQGVHAGPPQGISHAVPTGSSNPGTGLSLWGADVGAEGCPRAGRAAESSSGLARDDWQGAFFLSSPT